MMQRPEYPRNKPSDDPAWITYYKQMSKYVEEKAKADLALIPKTKPDSRTYTLAQKAEFKEPRTPEYLRKKRKEERDKAGCVDCGKPKVSKRIRCADCQITADRLSADRKNAAKRERQRLIREGLMERKGGK